MSNTFTFIIDQIPMIKIEGDDELYLYIYDSCVQISKTPDVFNIDNYISSSWTRPHDFENLTAKKLVFHIKECIRERRNIKFNFSYKDIPHEILKNFILSSIETSHHWREIRRGEYKINKQKYIA